MEEEKCNIYPSLKHILWVMLNHIHNEATDNKMPVDVGEAQCLVNATKHIHVSRTLKKCNECLV